MHVGLFISLGAFIENLELAAGSLGYKADIEITAKHKNDSNVATIHLSKSQKADTILAKLKTAEHFALHFIKLKYQKII